MGRLKKGLDAVIEETFALQMAFVPVYFGAILYNLGLIEKHWNTGMVMFFMLFHIVVTTVVFLIGIKEK